MALVDAPHIRFPFTRGPNGKVDVVEQGEDAHILSCEQVIASYPIGFRPSRPEFGWTFPTFRTWPLDPSELQAALRRFEPRSTASVQEIADMADQAVRHFWTTVPVSGDESNG